jgi:hypothetical protein
MWRCCPSTVTLNTYIQFATIAYVVHCRSELLKVTAVFELQRALIFPEFGFVFEAIRTTDQVGHRVCSLH